MLLLALSADLLFTGSASKAYAGFPAESQPTAVLLDPHETAHDLARFAQIKNIVANGHYHRFAVIEELAQSKSAAAFDVISSGLADEDLHFRMLAAKALGTLGDPRALPLLRKALHSRYTGMKLSATVALGLLGADAQPAVAELAAMLNQQFSPLHPSVAHVKPEERDFINKNITVRVHLAVLHALGRIGGQDAQAVITGVFKNGPGGEMAWEAALALKAMNARGALLKAGQNGSTAAWRMLADLKDDRGLDVMLDQVRHAELSLIQRRGVISALGFLGDRRATLLLLQMLSSESDAICEAAAMSLNRIADPQSLPGLLEYLRSAPPNSPGLYSAACAVGAIDTAAALDALRGLIDHPSSDVENAIAFRMGERATREDIPLLMRLLQECRQGTGPTKALVRLLPDSVPPLLQLLPNAEPSLQITIARIVAEHEPAALRSLLESQQEMVRESVRRILWEQRDLSVPLGERIDRNESFSRDERDIPELQRLIIEGSEHQSRVAVAMLFELEPRSAWQYIRPMFYQEKPAPLQAYNAVGDKHSPWLEQEIVGMLNQPGALSIGARKWLLKLLRKGNSISPEAVAIYRMYCDDSDTSVRFEAYQCLYAEASDESMALLASKALEGDPPARWMMGQSPDDRLADAFQQLLSRATENKETWLKGYVHIWATAPGVMEYVNVVGSQFPESLMKARQTASETIPD